MTSPNWRLIEAALVKIAKGQGYQVDERQSSGDKLCFVSCRQEPVDPDHCIYDKINLTQLAKDLEQELRP